MKLKLKVKRLFAHISSLHPHIKDLWNLLFSKTLMVVYKLGLQFLITFEELVKYTISYPNIIWSIIIITITYIFILLLLFILMKQY